VPKTHQKLSLPFFTTCTHTHTHTQLKFYAKANNPDDIQIDADSLGAAVCEDDQEEDYDSPPIIASFTCGIIVPFIVIILLAVMVYSNYSKIGAVINKEQNHANLAALVLTGLVFSTFVVVLDIWALILVVQGKREFITRYSNCNQTFIVITTALDTLAVVIAYITLICLFICLVCCRCKQTKYTLWILVVTCIAPLFCLASHSGYIIVAWISDTRYPGPVVYLYIFSFFYYFIIFRQVYKACNRHKEDKTCKQNGSTYSPLPCIIVQPNVERPNVE